MNNLQVVTLPTGANVPETVIKYQNSGLVAYAEPDYLAQVLLDPNNPLFTDGTQWALHNTGQNGGVAGADIDGPDAWNIRTSAANVVVALVDTGIRITHEDLAANIWVNPAGGRALTASTLWIC